MCLHLIIKMYWWLMQRGKFGGPSQSLMETMMVSLANLKGAFTILILLKTMILSCQCMFLKIMLRMSGSSSTVSGRLCCLGSVFSLMQYYNLVAIHPECNRIFFISDVDNTLRCYDMNRRKVCVICNMGCQRHWENRCLPYVPLFSKSLTGLN
jgi:hypothetical protein